MTSLSDPVVFDIECYPNFFLVVFRKIGTDRVREFSTDSRFSSEQIASLRRVCQSSTLIGYYSQQYDVPMLAASMEGWTVKQLKVLSDTIVSNSMPHWKTMREYGLHAVRCRAHIDLAMSAGAFAPSLKTIACRIGYPVVWELPYPPDQRLNDHEKEQVKRYCLNDLGVTEALFDIPSVRGVVDLRVNAKRTRTEPLDWLNAGIVQLGEKMIMHRAGIEKSDRKDAPHHGKCKVLPWLEFENEELQEMLEYVGNRMFVCRYNKFQLPEELNRNVEIAGMDCKFGIGGIHSESKGVYGTSGEYLIFEADVSSYYPHLIWKLGIEPPLMEGKFQKVYQGVLKERLEGKKSGDKVTAEVMKLVLNSAFGKLSNQFGRLFSPYDFASVTFNGQFGMLYLVEQLSKAGMTLIATNTDSVTCCFPRDFLDRFHEVCDDFAEKSGFPLDRDEIRGIWYRDINNYLAIYPDGSTKGKGTFADPGPSKAPYPICITNAVTGFLRDGIPIADTIHATWEPNDFILSRNIKAGAVCNDLSLGKNPRWVWQTDSWDTIQRADSGDKVPMSDGCKPLMDLREDFEPDHQRYIHAAEKLLDMMTKVRMC